MFEFCLICICKWGVLKFLYFCLCVLNEWFLRRGGGRILNCLANRRRGVGYTIYLYGFSNTRRGGRMHNMFIWIFFIQCDLFKFKCVKTVSLDSPFLISEDLCLCVCVCVCVCWMNEWMICFVNRRRRGVGYMNCFRNRRGVGYIIYLYGFSNMRRGGGRMHNMFILIFYLTWFIQCEMCKICCSSSPPLQ